MKSHALWPAILAVGLLGTAQAQTASETYFDFTLSAADFSASGILGGTLVGTDTYLVNYAKGTSNLGALTLLPTTGLYNNTPDYYVAGPFTVTDLLHMTGPLVLDPNGLGLQTPTTALNPIGSFGNATSFLGYLLGEVPVGASSDARSYIAMNFTVTVDTSANPGGTSGGTSGSSSGGSSGGSSGSGQTGSGSTGDPAGSVVPEPSTLYLGLIAVVAAYLASRKAEASRSV